MKILTALAMTVAVWGQTPPPTFQSGTNLVLVPVIVRDRDGKAIGNLTKEDFELLDQGKPQEIARFSLEKLAERAQKAAEQMKTLQAEASRGVGTAHPADQAMATRFVAYVFDDLHTDSGNLIQAREQARKFFENDMSPTDRAGIFTASGRVTVDFTHDLQQLQDGLRRILPQARMTGLTDHPPMTYYEAVLIMQNDATAVRVADLETIRSRGSNSTLLQRKSTMDITAAAASTLVEGRRNTEQTLQALSAVVTRMISLPGQRLAILLSPGFYVSELEAFRQSQLFDQAIRAGVVFNTLDTRGVYQSNPSFDASKEGYMPPAASTFIASFRQVEALTQGDILGQLADGTGGILFHNNNDMFQGLKETTAVPEFQYILGFSPRDLKYDGSFHKLKVNLKSKSGELQARRGYFAPAHPPDAAADLKQRMRDTMFSRDELLDIPVEVQTEFFKSPDGKANLSVVAKIDLKTLHYRAEEGRQVDSLTIDTGVFDPNGQMVDATSKTYALKFRQETFAQAIAKGMSEKTSFAVPSGNYVVRVVIHESEGDMMSARNGAVQIP